MQRHYGLDWLRVGAFAILILYHIGMVFVPWGFHAKLAAEQWLTVPMMLSNPWRLSLLFVVSGYASRALFVRHTGPWPFVRNRTARLLIPLAFGMAVIVPPQAWVELVTQHGYTGAFLPFWTGEYFGFQAIAGLYLPAWNHLWFVVYLWVYTLLFTASLAIALGSVRRWVQRVFDRLFGGVGALILPMAWLMMVSGVLFPGARETHALVGDWVAHATYFPMFLFGFAMAGSERVIATFARWWKVSAALAILAYLVVAGVQIAFAEYRVTPRPFGTVFSLARGVEGWMAIAALIGIAETFWNRDSRWRPMLTEAVFPFYIIHQTIIVVVAYWLLLAHLPLAIDFVILVTATVAGCWAFYLIGRRIPWLRPLIGLRLHRSSPEKPDPRPAIV
ncbi:acyltransferase family protein [Sphingomonas jeddahensis]|uniref:Glucans biosynthesis protein n=1 Tax=Sphingomonas jeddahensis TaxID=1915074 RepID=A0A1V2EV27_9SPHN|nr:acyltransferase family protein [Sphingomonas jeddahensis]ONF96526.1 glucans biosynthesis protein [Sphingomonas jeddahensis]